MEPGKMFIDGQWHAGDEVREIRSPFSGEVVSSFWIASESQVEAAIESIVRGFEAMRRLPSYRRAEILLAMRDCLARRKEEFARSIVLEAGKPIADARFEVERGINVLTLSAEEAKRIGGELMPLDLMPSSIGRFGITRRFPVGPIVGISPYNFPLNLGLHKVGPALACGSAIVWKPSLLTPGAALLFAELAEEAGLSPGALNVVTPPDSLAEKLVTDPRIRMVSFTGSARVGWGLRSRAGDKRVALELGGNAAVLVAADCDIDFAVERCVAGGFAYSGQVCISVQRILVEESICDEFLAKFVPSVKALRVGDPLDEATKMGPMVSEKEAARVESWIQEAVEGGAMLACGGARRGLLFEPAVLTSVQPDMKLVKEEAFGPVVTVEPFKSWEGAVEAVNRSSYGLQAGIFTRDLNRMFQAFKTLDVGGIIVNDVPSYRMDSMPYGGAKESGLGREGIRYSIDEMTEMRLLVINPAKSDSP